MSDGRVVVTGMGVVSPIGNGIEEFWHNLAAGKSGIRELPYMNAETLPHRLFGYVDDFDWSPYSHKRGIIGRASAFGIHATEMALAQAGLLDPGEDLLERTGVAMGTLSGDTSVREEVWLDQGWSPDAKRPFTPFTTALIPQNIADWFSLGGPSSTLSTACSASIYAVYSAIETINSGAARIMVTGGAEGISLISQGTFTRLNVLDDERIRPFDRDRRGTIMGEGAGVLVIETRESALQRGAGILAEISGIGLSCDGFHESAPETTGIQIIRAMRAALEDAGLGPAAIDCINAHGTGTPHNDKVEASAIKAVFGKRAGEIPVTANKSMLGHSFGAASGQAIVASILMIKNKLVVPTINYEYRDPECDLDFTANESRPRSLNHILINAAGFGGNNASIVISKYLDQERISKYPNREPISKYPDQEQRREN